jgi:hypothetical protein
VIAVGLVFQQKLDDSGGQLICRSSSGGKRPQSIPGRVYFAALPFSLEIIFLAAFEVFVRMFNLSLEVVLIDFKTLPLGLSNNQYGHCLVVTSEARAFVRRTSTSQLKAFERLLDRRANSLWINTIGRRFSRDGAWICGGEADSQTGNDG